MQKKKILNALNNIFEYYKFYSVRIVYVQYRHINIIIKDFYELKLFFFSPPPPTLFANLENRKLTWTLAGTEKGYLKFLVCADSENWKKNQKRKLGIYV